MLSLLRLFLDILFLRRGPQDVPVSTVLLGLAALLYAVINLGIGWWESTLPRALLAALLDIGLAAGLLFLALRARNLSVRFTQSYTAYLGTGALLGVLALPLVWFLNEMAGPSPAEIPMLAVLLWFVLLFWSLSVLAHILRNTLEAPLPLAALMAVGYTMLSMELSGRVLHGVT